METKMTKLNTVQCGTTRHLFDDASRAKVEAKIHRQMVDGDVLYHEDGRREYFQDEIIFDAATEGSGRFTWDKSGEKIKHKRFRVVASKKGRTISKQFDRAIYKSWE